MIVLQNVTAVYLSDTIHRAPARSPKYHEICHVYAIKASAERTSGLIVVIPPKALTPNIVASKSPPVACSDTCKRLYIQFGTTKRCSHDELLVHIFENIFGFLPRWINLMGVTFFDQVLCVQLFGIYTQTTPLNRQMSHYNYFLYHYIYYNSLNHII